MAPLRTAVALLCAATVLLLAEAAAVNKTIEAGFGDTSVTIDGEKYEVADPEDDGSESDSISQDSTAAWQTSMVQGLYAQRTAEKEFIDRLVKGGSSLNDMVNNITAAFKTLEDLRQTRGSQLIRAHFEDEIALLRNSSARILADLESTLNAQSSDSADVKALKEKVKTIFSEGFSQQLQNETTLFQNQMQQIREEHAVQNKSVTTLFTLLSDWKTSFQEGLKKSQAQLESIAESWDLL